MAADVGKANNAPIATVIPAIAPANVAFALLTHVPGKFPSCVTRQTLAYCSQPSSAIASRTVCFNGRSCPIRAALSAATKPRQMGARIAAGPHSTSIPSLARTPSARGIQHCSPSLAARLFHLCLQTVLIVSGPTDAVRGALPLGCCRSVLLHRVAPLSFVPSSDLTGASTCLPLRFRASAWCSCEQPERDVPGVAFLPGSRSRTRLRDARTSSREGRYGGLAVPFRLRPAPDGDQSPCRATACERCCQHPVLRSRKPQFRTSADQPEGTCQLVTLQTIRARVALHFFCEIQEFGP